MTSDYDIHLDDKFGQLQEFDVAAFAAEHEPIFSQALTTVNDSLVRVGVLEGSLDWHKHDDEDEFFLVLEGELEIDVEGRDTVVLEEHQAITITKQVMHRTRSKTRTVVLMVEQAGIAPAGDQ